MLADLAESATTASAPNFLRLCSETLSLDEIVAPSARVSQLIEQLRALELQYLQAVTLSNLLSQQDTALIGPETDVHLVTRSHERTHPPVNLNRVQESFEAAIQEMAVHFPECPDIGSLLAQAEGIARDQQTTLVEWHAARTEFVSRTGKLERELTQLDGQLPQLLALTRDKTAKQLALTGEYYRVLTGNLLLKMHCLQDELHASVFDSQVSALLSRFTKQLECENAALERDLLQSRRLLANLKGLGPGLLALANEHQHLCVQIEFIQEDIASLQSR